MLLGRAMTLLLTMPASPHGLLTMMRTKSAVSRRADYDALHTDYFESVDALQRATAVLTKGL